jgi:DNA-binding XRE family transcriptional regulator
MPDQMKRHIKELTLEQRARVEAFQTRHHTPEARLSERAAREAIANEFPPAVADEDVRATLAKLRQEREQQGLSLTDMAQRTGIDRATISKLENGRQPNPTLATLKRYAKALGKRIEIDMVV